MNVECDGCGVCPIVGPRFKCSVRKNFDYCSMCEERKDHPYAFLKINTPMQAPTAIFSVIDENQHPEAKTDGDINAGASSFRGGFQGQGPRHHHGPHGGNRHHPWKNHAKAANTARWNAFAGNGCRADGGSQPQNSSEAPAFDQAAF